MSDLNSALVVIEKKKAEIDRLESDFIWEHFFNYCKSFYAKGGVYGDEVDATDKEIELAILDILDDKEYEFEGDSWDRERVRSFIENRRKLKYNQMIYKATYQSMKHDITLSGETK
jgi:hypothetical protein